MRHVLFDIPLHDQGDAACSLKMVTETSKISRCWCQFKELYHIPWASVGLDAAGGNIHHHHSHLFFSLAAPGDPRHSVIWTLIYQSCFALCNIIVQFSDLDGVSDVCVGHHPRLICGGIVLSRFADQRLVLWRWDIPARAIRRAE